jgi:hypothetical protein
VILFIKIEYLKIEKSGSIPYLTIPPRTAYVGVRNEPQHFQALATHQQHTTYQIGFGFIAMQQRKIENLKEIITLLKTKTTVS